MARLTSILLALLVALVATVLSSPVPEPEAGRNHHGKHHEGGDEGNDDYGGYPCKECIASPNNCDITAPCSSFGPNLYCGCRPGYRASGVSTWDTSKQWRIDVVPGHEHRVWVAPGVVCNQLCTHPFGGNPCGEVAVENSCNA